MIRDQVLELIAYNAGLDLDEIDEDSTLTELGLDSLDITELTLQIEDDFGVALDDADWETTKTVNDLIISIERKAK